VPSEPSPEGISVSASKGAKELVLSFVNPSADKDVVVDCTVLGGAPKAVTADMLHNPDLNAFNSFEAPDQVVIQRHTARIEKDKIRLELPRLSVATASVELG
jgi:alpha-L-arabinofuranosidase